MGRKAGLDKPVQNTYTLEGWLGDWKKMAI